MKVLYWKISLLCAFACVGMVFSLLTAYAASFDYDLIPNSDGVFNIGFYPTPGWKDLYFGNDVVIGNRIAVGTSSFGGLLKVVASGAVVLSIDVEGNTRVQGNPIQVGVFASNPSSVNNGGIYYNATSNNFKAYENGSWTDIISRPADVFWSSDGGNIWNLNSNNIGIGISSGIVDALTVGGVIDNRVGGFRFPDGNVWSSGRNSILSTSSNDTALLSGGYSYRGLAFTRTSTVMWALVAPVTWFGFRVEHTSVVHDNRMWVIGGMGLGQGGFTNDVWYSTDGVVWTRSVSGPWQGRYAHTSLVFNNRMWVMGGISSTPMRDIWYSVNGSLWTLATGAPRWTARADHASVVFNNRMWVIGGCECPKGWDTNYKNDVWYSLNGVIWTRSTSRASWSERGGHAVVVFNNKMWLLGGQFKNDVWYSSDGAIWTRATASAPWVGREDHTAVVYDNKIWIMGGYPAIGSQGTNDVWYSSDGFLWTMAVENAEWSKRTNHTSPIFNGKIWVIGGWFWYTPRLDVWTNDQKIYLYNNF
ncbi:MAG: hypothetical protein A2586_02305 [Candidatus Harrisonbacteria bacterium RIFOXYD1_FULL_40_9]|uniref:Bulb-type lectin domain-containing protein n=1 Tax=Candidatus Harrisonbacteria bacterium RIFOXYD1_FULL_40_9 TaxID=1798412 RepID=A0A1G1ZWI8_9BACT|nr:MAG: hypothetical protein A2586_02305 [Candidatus Harrisonbacteria bacterium RIFOXYD1_FULL_40_9]